MAMHLTRFLIPIMVGAMFSRAVQMTAADEPLVFISAFTSGDEGAIYAYTLRPDTGRLTLVHRTTDVENPFFLAVSPDRRFLYSIHAQSSGGKEHEQVAAYEIVGRSGKLKLLNRQSALGSAACYLDVDATGKTVLVANYSTGTNRGHDSIAAYQIGDDGRLTLVGITPSLGRGPQNLAITPDGRLLLCANMPGDNVAVFRIDQQSGGLESAGEPISMPKPSCIMLLP